MKNLNVFAGSFLTTAALLFFQVGVSAQTYSDSLAQDDQDILSSIAPYQPDVRSAILDVAQYPQALVKIERIQARSSQSFQDMVEELPREEQEKIYETSRFPDIVTQLTDNGKLDPGQINNVIKDLPAETQIRLREVYANHFDILQKMNKIGGTSQDGLQKIIGGYPQDVQADFQKVVGMPDVINLLTENINMTVSLGEQYKADPNGVRQQLDALSAKLTEQNAKDLDAYKTEVAADPKLQAEMKTAATEFSTTNDQPDNPNYVTNTQYDNNPYPYWSGYPYWYTQPIWYPRPFYYNTGFYYGAGGGLVVVGLPSRAYSSWFFGSGYRRYPLLYNHYNGYYNFHHGVYGNVYRGFNYSTREHFNTGYRGNAGRGYVNGGRTSINNRTTVVNNHNTNINRTVRTNQMHVSPGNVNTRGMQQFHATTYHSMGWQHVNSGARPSGGGGFRSTGGSGAHFGGGGGGRSSGGGGHSGGGGGHGGGGRH